jgi:hypothetical protein
MFAALAEFRLVRSRRIAPAPHKAVTHSNDNLPGVRPPANGRRPSPTPALACRWFNRGGRLECRWIAEPKDAPSGAFDEHPAPARSRGRSSMLPHGRGLALTG